MDTGTGTGMGTGLGLRPNGFGGGGVGSCVGAPLGGIPGGEGLCYGGFESAEQLEQAMVVTLRTGERARLLGLLRRCGPACLPALRPPLQAYLCESLVGMLGTAGHDLCGDGHPAAVVRQLLPWLDQAVRCGAVGILPPRVREMLASALQGLSHLPGEDSIRACQLYAHFATPSALV
jgi:hypothetical protein